jgi:hypothetical protein
VQWSPRPVETGALVAVGLLLAGAVLLVDTAGRVLIGTAAVLMLGIAVRDVVARPRLSAGPDGVDVRGWTSRTHLPWPGLRIDVRETRRFGVRNRTLELDTAAGPDEDGVLVVLGRRDLGADPAEVARALAALDPTAGRATG